MQLDNIAVLRNRARALWFMESPFDRYDSVYPSCGDYCLLVVQPHHCISSFHLHVVSFGPPSNMFEERYDDQWEKANDGSAGGGNGNSRQRLAPAPSRGVVSTRQGQGPFPSAPHLGLVDAAVHGVHSDFVETLRIFPSRLRV